MGDKAKLVRAYLSQIKAKFARKSHKTIITRPLFPPSSENLKKPLLIICSPEFNQEFPIAGTLMRLGFARGWAETCGPAKLVPVSEIVKELNLFDNPAILMSQYDFQHLTSREVKCLRDVDLFVWVGIHPRMYTNWERTVLNCPIDMPLDTYAKLMLAEPKFVWNAVGEAAREWYQGWRDDGLHWETIYPAADIHRYFPDPAPEKYGHIQMAYVGGYWPEKAQGFDLYLRPWEDFLVPYGYDKWPYKNYGGQIDEVCERQLYSSVGLVPLVTSPAGWRMAEITERYLKAPACRAFCISDQNPALREIFNADEMIQAENAEHFHDLIKDFLKGNIDTKVWVDKAYAAVQERHLYIHRALQIKKALGF